MRDGIGKRRHVGAWLLGVLAIAGVGLALSTTANDGAGAGSSAVILTQGTYHGVGWRLDASLSADGSLCLQLDGPRDSAKLGYPGQCGFYAEKAPPLSYWMDGLGPAGSTVTFGPLPTNAVAIRIATHEVIRTSALPDTGGLPAGRYWLSITPPDWPTASDGAALDTPQPLDSHGHPVGFEDF